MELTNEQRMILIDWIDRYLIPRKTINPYMNTSDIRKAFMNTYSKGFYLSNAALNDIMQEAGYRAANFTADPYLKFNVSSQSPAFREYHQWVLNPSTFQMCE